MSGLLIGLTGATGVGKDTVGKFLVDGFAAVRVAFGDPVKAATMCAFGLEEAWLRDDHKTVVHPYWTITPREMFQLVGTEAFRGTFGADFWVKRAALEVARIRHTQPNRMIVITDVRAPNNIETEADWIRGNGGVIVHVTGPQRRGDVNAAHSSNSTVVVRDGDYWVQNDDSLSALEMRVTNVIASIVKEKQNAPA